MSPSLRPSKGSPTLQAESLLYSQGVRPIAGVDEAGRGPLAGPVVAAAVILPEVLNSDLTRISHTDHLRQPVSQMDAVLDSFFDLDNTSARESLGQTAVTVRLGAAHKASQPPCHDQYEIFGLIKSLSLLNDSKKLRPKLREELFIILTTHPQIDWALGEASVEEIGELNILRATALAMRRALLALTRTPAHALVDGLPVRDLPVPQTALVGGDGLSLSIAAASVIAKVTRDRIMDGLDQAFPCYGFARHRGYGTAEHLKTLNQYGPCKHHRRGFKPVDQASFAF